MVVITPCYDFAKYGVWLRKQFPHIITATGSFFVHSNLKIRSQREIEFFMEFSPEDWQNHLPRSYHIWRKTIIELIIIWTVTSEMDRDITYTKYMETRNEMLPVLDTIYEETPAPKNDSWINDILGYFDSPQSPSSPPPYQKVSPAVIQWQSKCMKDNDPPGSTRSYKTIPPALIDPYDQEELDAIKRSINNASHRSQRSQIPTYDPKVVNMHKRPPKNKILLTRTKDLMEIDHNGGDGGDGGIYTFIKLKFFILQEP